MKTIYFFTKLCVGLLLIASFAVSCNSTRVISSWKLDPVPTGAMEKTLVLGVMANRETRDQVEQVMTSELNNAGVQATTATSLFGPRGFHGLTEDRITEKLKGSGFTSVMIISLRDREHSTSYIPGTFYTSPRIVGFNRFYRRYLVVYDRMYIPGRVTQNTNYILEAEIYTISDDGQLIYSAQTRSFNPNSARSLAQNFSRSIITELRTIGII